MGTRQEGAAPDVAVLFNRVPTGWSVVSYEGRRYGVTKTVRVSGRSCSVLAHELGGSDLVSANLYLTSTAVELRPCEMPVAKVLGFLAGLRLLTTSRDAGT